jgi:hypothetical protein
MANGWPGWSSWMTLEGGGMVTYVGRRQQWVQPAREGMGGRAGEVLSVSGLARVLVAEVGWPFFGLGEGKEGSPGGP